MAIIRRSVCATTLLSLLALGSLSAGSSPPAVVDPGGPGPYAVSHTSFTTIDTSRDAGSSFGGRPIPVNVWYPADWSAVPEDPAPAVYPLDPIYGKWPVSTSQHWEQFGMAAAYENLEPSISKPFPLVVISPGLGGRYWSSLSYILRLASHGFVVAVAQHYHDQAYIWDTMDPLDRVMLNRPLDISFMLDAVLARNNDPGDLLYNAVHPEFVAASGHSLGGYAAMVLAGGDDEVCGTMDDPAPASCISLGTTLPDPRIKAIVPLGAANQFLHFAELARITVPSMGIGEDWETVQDFQARQHAAIQGHPNYRVDLLNTVHTSLAVGCTAMRVLHALGAATAAQLKNTLTSAQCTTALPQPEAARLAAKYAAAFLKTHMVGETGYQHILTPGWAITQEPDIEFFLTERRDPASIDEDWPESFIYFPHQPGSARLLGEREPAKRRPLERIE